MRKPATLNRNRAKPSRITRAIRQIDRVLTVYRAHAPSLIEGVGVGHPEDWRVLGPVLLARAAYALDTLRVLATRDVDAAVVTRTLYETVLTFAWIAINPQPHAFRWLRTDREERLTAMLELKEFGIPVDPAVVRKYEIDVTIAKKPMPKVYVMAREADAHWMRAIPEFTSETHKYEFRGGYTAIYRAASGAVHARQTWLNSFVQNAKRGGLRITDPVPGQKPGMVTIAPYCFGGGLLVSAVRLGWPPADRVMGAFDEDEDE
jgi:hypothetical protein